MADKRSRWHLRLIGWGIAALLVLLPLIANLAWTTFDFIFLGVLLGGTGVLVELIALKSDDHAYQGGVAAAVAAALVILVATGAVGMIGGEENRYNLLFFAVIAVALVGAAIAGFRPDGMAGAMLAAAIAQVAVAAGGMPSDIRGGILSAVAGGLWLLSAALFRRASAPMAKRRTPDARHFAKHLVKRARSPSGDATINEGNSSNDLYRFSGQHPARDNHDHGAGGRDAHGGCSSSRFQGPGHCLSWKRLIPMMDPALR